MARVTWESNFVTGGSVDTLAELRRVVNSSDQSDQSVPNTIADILIELQKRVGVGFGENWNYFTTEQPAGVGVAPEAVWAFDLDEVDPLADISGNSHDLTLAAGTTRYNAIGSGISALALGSDTYYTAANPSGLETQGAVTQEIVYAGQGTTVFDVFYQMGTTATNSQYGMRMQNLGQISSYHDYGVGGTPVNLIFDTIVPLGQWTHIALTRDAAGLVHNLYMQGVHIGTETTVNPPDQTGGLFTLFFDVWGAVLTGKITKAEFTPAQVAESYSALRAAA